MSHEDNARLLHTMRIVRAGFRSGYLRTADACRMLDLPVPDETLASVPKQSEPAPVTSMAQSLADIAEQYRGFLNSPAPFLPIVPLMYQPLYQPPAPLPWPAITQQGDPPPRWLDRSYHVKDTVACARCAGQPGDTTCPLCLGTGEVT